MRQAAAERVVVLPDHRSGNIAYVENFLVIGAAAIGLYCFAPQLSVLWKAWTSDPLRSSGILIPPVSLLLCLRAWRGHDWRTSGSPWGVALIVVALAGAKLGGTYQLGLMVFPGALISGLPIGLLLSVYASGVVLLLGGKEAFRKALFPLMLLLVINPVPSFINGLFDLRLQYLAVRVARAFASALGTRVSGEQLQMIFAPDFGMFIAPGCNGLRGAVAMGYLSLVIGYLSQLTVPRRTLYFVCAVALAYLLNLIRLCTLVLFYWVALRFELLQDHALLADYLIGGTIFFISAGFLFGVPRMAAVR
jgi:exosortase J